MAATVIAVLRRFIPPFRQTAPPLSADQRRALWALTHCRTPALGGQAFGCAECGGVRFAWHSCNHKACPQCGRADTARWIRRELNKLLPAPYFLVTFTLPAQLRGEFFGPHAREAFDLFFRGAAGALREKLAADKDLRAVVHGFTAVLHTWNQKLGFHPHIHCLVPGSGLDGQGRLVRVKNAARLVHLDHLQAAFRQHCYRLFKARGWGVDPAVWNLDWGVHIQPAGAGAAALKYLGTYVTRTAISDARLLKVTATHVTFRWQDREHDRTRKLRLPGVEFVRRYLRHVLPKGLRAVRYYGFCHPRARAHRLRVRFLAGGPVSLGAAPSPTPKTTPPGCPRCDRPMKRLGSVPPQRHSRAPPEVLGPLRPVQLQHTI
jgi:hypothetical protein